MDGRIGSLPTLAVPPPAMGARTSRSVGLASLSIRLRRTYHDTAVLLTAQRTAILPPMYIIRYANGMKVSITEFRQHLFERVSAGKQSKLVHQGPTVPLVIPEGG